MNSINSDYQIVKDLMEANLITKLEIVLTIFLYLTPFLLAYTIKKIIDKKFEKGK